MKTFLIFYGQILSSSIARHSKLIVIFFTCRPRLAYKNLHETLETLDTFPCLKGMTPHSTVSESQLSHVIFLHGDIANIATFASAFFSFVYCVGMLFRHLFTTPREGRIVSDSLEIPWWFVGGYATHYVP